MSRYFEYFPKTQYTVANSSFSISPVVTNITLKARIVDDFAADDPYLYLPYTVEDGERPEHVSNFYYGSTDHVWLVFFSNDIVDPYTQWVMSDRDFTNYFRKKYAASANTIDPIFWGQNTEITDNISHYENNANNEILISKDSYTHRQTFDGDFVPGDWSAVRYWDFEVAENEKKRNIQLLNAIYAQRAISNLRELLANE